MKYYLIYVLVLITLSGVFSSCNPDDPPAITEKPDVLPDDNRPEAPEDNEEGNDNEDNSPSGNRLNLRVGSALFTVTLEDNPASTAFRAMLPMTLNMSDLNGNEKFYNLTYHLPSHETVPGIIHEGDLMLYGSDCIVLFYRNFNTSYRYTKLGAIGNPEGLEEALGKNNIELKFELITN